jgi:hypothetical protein
MGKPWCCLQGIGSRQATKLAASPLMTFRASGHGCYVVPLRSCEVDKPPCPRGHCIVSGRRGLHRSFDMVRYHTSSTVLKPIYLHPAFFLRPPKQCFRAFRRVVPPLTSDRAASSDGPHWVPGNFFALASRARGQRSGWRDVSDVLGGYPSQARAELKRSRARLVCVWRWSGVTFCRHCCPGGGEASYGRAAHRLTLDEGMLSGQED